MRTILAALTLASLTLVNPAAAADPKPGEYGVVCFDPAIGKLKGVRVILSGPSASPTVVLQYCDGGCSGHRTTSSSLTGQDLKFEIANNADAEQTARFSGRFRSNALDLKSHTEAFSFKEGRLRLNERCPKDTVKADP